MIKQEDVFKIGQFAKPHGIKGEITLVTECDVFDEADEQFVICNMDGILVPFYVEDFRYKTDTTMLLKLEGVNTDAEAREFANRDVYYPLDKMDDDSMLNEMTWENFIGFKVIDGEFGEVGVIEDVDDSTANVLLQLKYKGRELLLPAAEELVTDLDLDKKEMHVSLPAGLLDL